MSRASSSSSQRNLSPISLLIAIVIMLSLGLLWFLDPQHQYTPIGPLTDFAPSQEPYPVTIGDTHVYVVNTGTGVIIISRRYVTNNPAWNCHIVWVPTNRRYEDPCSGAKFSLDGSWLATVYVPTELEPRGLERLAVQLRNDKVWINPTLVTPGAPASTPTP